MKFLLILFCSVAWAETIIVEDPTAQVIHELPSGDVFLKTYRAPLSLIDSYSRHWKVEGGDIKDNPKAPECTRAEVDALKNWASNYYYREVNRILREVSHGMVGGVKVTEKMEALVLTIASGVNCAPQYEGEVVRVEDTPDPILAQYQPGNHVMMRGFTSTTKGKEIAPSLSITNAEKISIAVARGADIDVLDVAQWPEKEVLIRPGTVFKVISRKFLDSPGFGLDHEFIFEQFY